MVRVTLDDIMDAANKLEELRNKYLRGRGWDHTCQTPGSHWLWRKTIDGHEYCCSEATALNLEEYLDYSEACLRESLGRQNLSDPTVTVSPHDFDPYRWYDRLHRNGRCRGCIVPKQGHPVPMWINARAVNDGRYYNPPSVLASVLRDLKRASRGQDGSNG